MGKGSILLVNPLPTGVMRVSTPMGLGYVGASLEKAGYGVRLFDQLLEPRLDLWDVLQEYKPEVVGLTGYSFQYPSLKSSADISKKFGSVVVVGGVHSSAYPEHILGDCNSIDFVIKGEGEKSFTRLLDGELKGVPGLYYRSSGHIEGNLPELIEDLDSLPSPWRVLNPRSYGAHRPAGMVSRHSPVASILSSRGCPYNCSFCCASVVQGKKIRLRSVPNVLDEIELLVRHFGIKDIQIVDDNFSFYPEHILGVCRGIRKRGLKFSWALANGIRADRVNEEILREMKESGCYYFALGIESGSERILKSISKDLSLDSVESTTKIASRMGFITQGFFMVGFPGETEEDRRISSRFASRLRLDRIGVTPVMALPGSELFNSQYGGKLDGYDCTQSSPKGWKPVPGASSHSTIRWSIRRMKLKFYLNPVRAFRHILKVRTLHQALGMLKGFVAVIEE